MNRTLAFLAFTLVATQNDLVAGDSHVRMLRAPEGAIQPQCAIDYTGRIHLVYYSGSVDAGDIYYATPDSAALNFGTSVRVNSRPGSAMAAGTIRGAQLALGRNGRVHVLWNGMGKGATNVSIKGREVAPLLYTRLNDRGTGFEPERNIITSAPGLDGGSSIAADSEGNVYAVWQAPEPGNTNEEPPRALFIARSTDDGVHFSPEKPALKRRTGACPCCGMRAFADVSGALYVLFRSARDEMSRDALIISAPAPGADFSEVLSHPWRTGTCPMSSATCANSKEGVVAAWETAGQVYFARISRKTMRASTPVAPTGSGSRKHPVVVSNAQGLTLLAWTENAGWGTAGTVYWQVFNSDDKPVGSISRAENLPPWSLATAAALPGGEFLLIY